MANPRIFGPFTSVVSAYDWLPLNYNFKTPAQVGVFVVTSGGGETRFRVDQTISPIYESGAVIEPVTASIAATIGNGGRAVAAFTLTDLMATAVRFVVQQVSGSARVKAEILRTKIG